MNKLAKLVAGAGARVFRYYFQNRQEDLGRQFISINNCTAAVENICSNVKTSKNCYIKQYRIKKIGKIDESL